MMNLFIQKETNRYNLIPSGVTSTAQFGGSGNSSSNAPPAMFSPVIEVLIERPANELFTVRGKKLHSKK